MNIHSKTTKMKRNVLITGTSTGVGFESAVLFAQNGYKVYATMRNLKKATELKEKIEAEQQAMRERTAHQNYTKY